MRPAPLLFCLWVQKNAPRKGAFMRQDRQERPEYSSFHILAPSSLGPEGGNYRFILTISLYHGVREQDNHQRCYDRRRKPFYQ